MLWRMSWVHHAEALAPKFGQVGDKGSGFFVRARAQVAVAAADASQLQRTGELRVAPPSTAARS